MYQNKEFGDFEINDLIGFGAFSEVYCGKHKRTGQRIAIKVIDLTQITPEEEPGIFREISTMISVSQHPYISTLYYFMIVDNHLFLFMEYVTGGSIADKLHKIGQFAEQQARKHFLEILSALAFLHGSLSVYHRDLKLQNVLLSYDGRAKLIDFGLCVSTDEIKSNFSGTVGYAAPEVCAETPYGVKADIFSLAVCLYTMVTGQAPFESHRDYPKLLEDIENIPYPPTMSAPLVQLLKGMFDPKPDSRWYFSQILSCEWIQEGNISQYCFSYPMNKIPLKLNGPLIPSLQSLKFLKVPNPEAKTVEDLVKLGFNEQEIKSDLLTGQVTSASSTFLIQRQLNQQNAVVPQIERACSKEVDRFLSRLDHL